MSQNYNTKPEIADYDASKYDYELYWKGRAYEDMADKIALEDLLQNHIQKGKKEGIYIDIGGSYGREALIYAAYFEHVILFDYSFNLLKKGKKYLDDKGISNISYIAGNVYELPFSANSIDGGQMVRVMHHLKNPQLAIDEINRVITNFFILEFANKIHAKYVLKNILHSKTRNELTPLQQTFRSTSQGSKGDDQIFLNFHPEHINSIIAETNFVIKKKLSVSNFRSPLLKKFIPEAVLVGAEKRLQLSLSNFYFGPSMYYDLQKKSKILTKPFLSIENLIVCPKCHEQFHNLLCPKCQFKFKINEGIYDLRYREDEI